MKKLHFTILVIGYWLCAASGAAQTRSIVPRADGEGTIGTPSKKWGTNYANAIVLGGVARTTWPADLLSGGSIYGNASGVSNAVDLIAGSGVNITSNVNRRTFTIAATAPTNNSALAGVIGNSGASIGTSLDGYPSPHFTTAVYVDTVKLTDNGSGKLIAELGFSGDGTALTLGLTNNTGAPGLVVGKGIGTNLSNIPLLNSTNRFTGTNLFDTITFGTGNDGKIFGGAGVLHFYGASGAFSFDSTARGDSLGHVIAADYTGSGAQLSALNAANITVGGTLPVLNGANITNLAATNLVYYTNANGVRPDFALPYSLLSTNAAFAFLAPTNVLSTRAQTCVVVVTNTTAAAVAVTAPSPIHTQGTWLVTNVTVFTFFQYGGSLTNAIALPLY